MPSLGRVPKEEVKLSCLETISLCTQTALLFPSATEGAELKPDCWQLGPNIMTKCCVPDRVSGTYHSFAKDRSGWSRSCKPETREYMECSVRKQTHTGDIQSSSLVLPLPSSTEVFPSRMYSPCPLDNTTPRLQARRKTKSLSARKGVIPCSYNPYRHELPPQLLKKRTQSEED